MSSKKMPFNWPQVAVLFISAGMTLFTGAQMAVAWSAMVLLQSDYSGREGSVPGLVLMFLPLALVVLSALAFIRLLVSRATLVAPVYLIGIFLLYSLAAGLTWILTDQAAWFDLAWLLVLVTLFFALGHLERTRLAPPEQVRANG